MSAFVKASLRPHFPNECSFYTLAKMQLHAQLHRQIHGNIFLRVIYSKQQAQLETEEVSFHTALCLTANGVTENLEKTETYSTVITNQYLSGINIFGSTYSLT